MTKVLVCGVVNLETTVAVDALPLPSTPVLYRPGGLTQRLGGVGFNLARTLSALGQQVVVAAPLAADLPGKQLRNELRHGGFSTVFVRSVLSGTPQSVVLVAPDGSRQIMTDLKDIAKCPYPPTSFGRALRGVEMALLTNAPFVAPLLEIAVQAGIPVLTDLHVVERLDNPYDAPWLAAADFLFASAEGWHGAPEAMAQGLMERSRARVVVLGMGARGAMLLERGAVPMIVPAWSGGRVRNTTGAGDTLAAGFADGVVRGFSPLLALKRACRYAGQHVAGVPFSADGCLVG